jgi:DNA (cytosine-5)-methyltransferase 1
MTTHETGGIPIGNRYKLIDLFSGAGGLTLGFSEAFGNPFKSVWANDFNKESAASYNANFGEHCVLGDIIDLLNDPSIVIPQADLVIGGPPCQGFSLLNQNKNKGDDPRKHLWRPYLDVVMRSCASVFVMENVPQLLDTPEFEQIVEVAERMNFKLAWAKLRAADYGVPQLRTRAFIIGCKFTDPSELFPPLKTHFNPDNGVSASLFGHNGYVASPQPWRTVKDAIEDLPPPIGTEIRNEAPPLDLHFGRNPTPLSLERYRVISEEGMNRFDLQRLAPELTPECWIRKTKGGTDLFGRLWWNRPAFTIRTEFYKPEKGRTLHPTQHRPITHREAARFQSFPDSFRFCGNKREIAKQIGNAVPPLLASHVAGCVAELFASREEGSARQVHAKRA